MAYGTEIEMEIYSEFDENTGVLSGSLSSMSLKTSEHPGFYTFPLDQSFPAQQGDEIFIKIKYTTPAYDWPIPIELYIETYSDPFIETGVSWISSSGQNGDWEAIGANTANDFDLCVNLYGQFNPVTIPLENHIIIGIFIALLGFYGIKKLF